jgi:hypothetical protein
MQDSLRGPRREGEQPLVSTVTGEYGVASGFERARDQGVEHGLEDARRPGTEGSEFQRGTE